MEKVEEECYCSSMRDEKLHDLNALLWRGDQISNQEGVVMATPGVVGSHHPR